MCEILFRGKRIDNGEWVEGDLIHNWIIGLEEETRIAMFDFDYNKGTEINGEAIYNVYPDTVGQYTDLTDKNGVKIFEGDVVIFNRGRNLPKTDKSPEVIIYHQGDCAFQRYPYCRCITKSGTGKLIQPDMMSECEVIGNIYDNPELLKGKEKCLNT